MQEGRTNEKVRKNTEKERKAGEMRSGQRVKRERCGKRK